MNRADRDRPEDRQEERVIADMSSLAPGRTMLIPNFGAGEKPGPSSEGRPQISTDEAKAYAKGAIAATLLIYGVFAAGLGAVIFLITLWAK